MPDPVVAAATPIGLDLEAGTYFWCSCGKSENQPWCDGKHRGSGLVPQKLAILEPKKVFLCRCKQTSNPPFCDGSHARLA